jgi:predicted ATPase/class 3 adenylate cyclase
MTSLPGDTVTFLMTDVEGSTVLWEKYPEVMPLALARHDEIMSAGIAAHGGIVVKHRGEGDSVFAVFARAHDAVVAACDLQVALHRELWPLSDPFRVRMALHTGKAEQRGGDYFGLTVNRCARLRAIAHGGQTLLSAATATLVADSLPDGVHLRDLGRHRLRDLTQPEQVLQVLHPDLSDTFPPVRSLDRHAHNLPEQTTPFVGREQDLAAVKALLTRADLRLLNLTGPGGIGKTRLSLQIAADLVDHFEDGVFFVDLSLVSDPSLVVPSVAQAVGVREAPARSLRDGLHAFLVGKHLLLILDNFEQLLPAVSDVAAMLSVCPKLHVLVSSRTVLHLSGEHVYPISPLGVPDPLPEKGALPLISSILAHEAIQLFEVRARAVKPDFAINAGNAAAIVAICRQLDGLPLAIELAAARIRMLPPQAIARRLVNALPLLTGGARDLPTRQQTLRQAIAWSYDLLAEPERALFRRLSVFAGGCTIEAAEAVANAADDAITAPALDVLEGISALLDASLVEQREMPDGEPRFRMLGVVRQFGMEELAACGEARWVQQRHANVYLELALTAEPRLHGAEQQAWLDRLRIEQDNIRAALAWFRDEGDNERYLRLAGALFWFWVGNGDWSEALEWYRDALARAPERTLTRARALYGAGTIHRLLTDYAVARRWLEEGISIARELGDRSLEARTIHILAILLQEEGDHAGARAMKAEGLAIAREVNDGWAMGVLLRELAGTAWQDGEIEEAGAYIEESVEIHRRMDEQWALAHALNAYGDLMRAVQRYDDAELRYQESLQLFVKLGVKDGRPSVLHNLGYVALGQGEAARSAHYFREALELFQTLGDQRGIAECIAGFASALGALGSAREAARLYGGAQAVFDRTGTQISTSNAVEHERYLRSVRETLGESSFDSAFDQGRGTALDDLIAEVLGTAIDSVVYGCW